MTTDDVTLALIEARVASDRQRHQAALARQSRREARRAERVTRPPWWWAVDVPGVRLLPGTTRHPSAGCRPRR
jgi:hypothetical protein